MVCSHAYWGRVFGEAQKPNRDGQGKAARAGAAGIDIKNAAAIFDKRLVRVAVYDGGYASRLGADLKIVQVVHDIDAMSIDGYYGIGRKGCGPRAVVHVAANGGDGSDGRKRA